MKLTDPSLLPSDRVGTIPQTAAKTVHIKTYGCQMNVYDSERMEEALQAEGYSGVETPEAADLIVLNTCHIRERAVEKVYSELGRIREIKDQRAEAGKETVVAITGCVAQAEGGEIRRRAPVVDLVVGPQSYHRLPALIKGLASGSRHVVETEFPDEDKFAILPARMAPRQASAFLTVQEGCDKFCTFCVVPYTRGMEFSRPVVHIEDEAASLVAGGVREITLLGQNVNAYHGDGPDGGAWSLARLIERLSRIDGLERLRYMTSHPHDMQDDLIAAHRDLPKLMPYLHLPFQAGSDRILAAMNRKHTVAEYRTLIDRIRTAKPEIALSTDIIVGFPGETDEEFAQTLAVVREVGFAQAYSFKYSARPGTPASNMDGQIEDAIKVRRLAELQALLQAQSQNFNQRCVGRIFPVLFERHGRQNGQLIGRSPYLQSVHATADDQLLGQILPVQIQSAGPNSLSGVIQAT